MPSLKGVLETALYVEDVQRSAGFYRSVFQFPTLVEDQRLCALDVVGRQVLLLFRRGGSAKPSVMKGGILPGHDGSGTTHLAFAIGATELEAWKRCLEENGVAIESAVVWPEGGTSLYFRDPDDHLIELATPGVWATY